MRQARQRQLQVWGVHGRGLSGCGQQVHLWPLSIPDPAVRLISPGRRVVRRVTSCHRPWPGCWAPTNPPSRRARPSRSRITYPRYAPTVGPAGQVWVRPAARRGDGRRVLDHHFPRLAHDIEPLQLQQGPGPTLGRGRGRRRSARSWPSADRRTGRGRLASGLPLVSDSHPPAPLHAAPMSRQDGRTAQGTAPATAGKFTDTGYAGERLS
jgi:hypothetical protein